RRELRRAQQLGNQIEVHAGQHGVVERGLFFYQLFEERSLPEEVARGLEDFDRRGRRGLGEETYFPDKLTALALCHLLAIDADGKSTAVNEEPPVEFLALLDKLLATLGDRPRAAVQERRECIRGEAHQTLHPMADFSPNNDRRGDQDQVLDNILPCQREHERKLLKDLPGYYDDGEEGAGHMQEE